MSNVVTTRVSDEVLAMIERLSASRERSRAWVVGKLVEGAARRQIEMDEFLQEGIDAIEGGDFYTQEQMEEWADSLVEGRSKAA